MNLNDCINEGLLKKIVPDKNKSFSSIEMSEHKLNLSEKEFENNLFESALISAYTSMFHAARAVLFKEGFKERSHYAVYVYLSEKYSNKIEKRLLNEFNALRMERHELMYGLNISEEVKEVEAENTINIAKDFLNSIKKIIKSD